MYEIPTHSTKRIITVINNISSVLMILSNILFTSLSLFYIYNSTIFLFCQVFIYVFIFVHCASAYATAFNVSIMLFTSYAVPLHSVLFFSSSSNRIPFALSTTFDFGVPYFTILISFHSTLGI